jgi:hypothetical protein
MDGDQPPITSQHPAAGDIVVTRVANHYHVSRVLLEGRPWVSIQAFDSESDALTLACGLILEPQRVLLYARGDRHHYVQIDCANPYWEHR